jgi:dinuclear metal center YbgI/SA1388 family protein
MGCTCQVILDVMNRIAPFRLAESWDNVGLILGHKDQMVKRILVSLDITQDVVEEAIAKDVDLILSHHPLIFKPVKGVLQHIGPGKMIYPLIQNNIAVLTAHTNLDIAKGGVNDILARKLKLIDVKPLQKIKEPYKKIIVFVPKGYEDTVMKGMAEAGAGWIGKYSESTFQVCGTGTFRPGRGTKPFIGKTGELQRVAEIRLETVGHESQIPDIMTAILMNHPYEEPAFDIYPLDYPHGEMGLGRVGFLEQATALDDLAHRVGKELGSSQLRVVGEGKKKIKKVAVCGGSGASLIPDAVGAGSDVLVTGDIKYHDAQDAKAMGLAIIDAGHYETERPVIPSLINRLQNEFVALQYKIDVIESSVRGNPF